MIRNEYQNNSNQDIDISDLPEIVPNTNEFVASNGERKVKGQVRFGDVAATSARCVKNSSSDPRSSGLEKIKSEGSLAFVTEDMSKQLESRVVNKMDRLLIKMGEIDNKREHAKTMYDETQKQIERLDNLKIEKIKMNSIMKSATNKFITNLRNKNNGSTTSTSSKGDDLQKLQMNRRTSTEIRHDLRELQMMNDENERLTNEANKWQSLYYKKNKQHEHLRETLDNIVALIRKCEMNNAA